MANIDIIVNGSNLVLYKDTTINFEYNNALFAKEAIDGDVAFSFNIPIIGNELALEFSNEPYVRNSKKFDCGIMIHGLNLVSGKLIVQDVTHIDFSVAVICNPYPEGFRDKEITKNESETIVISEKKENHHDGWKRFLLESINDGSNIKFAPYINDDAYKDDNKDFGFWDGRDVEKVVNRLFIDNDNNIIERRDSNPFVRLFNETHQLTEEDNTYAEMNQLSFSPQIRVSSIFKNIISSAGYSFINHINKELDNVFIQSPRALDGDIGEYGEDKKSYSLHVSSQSLFYEKLLSEDFNDDNMLIPLPNGRKNENCFKFYQAGWYKFDAKGKFHTPHTAKRYFAITQISGKMPSNPLIKEFIGTYNAQEYKSGKYAGEELYNISFQGTIYIPSNYLNIPLYVGFFYDLNQDESLTQEYFGYGGLSEIDIKTLSLEEGGLFNIFSNSFRFAELFPEVSNGDFILKMIQSLGLAYYVNSRSKQIEIASLHDLMSAGSIDLSEYVLTKETKIVSPEEKKYSLVLGCKSPKEIEDDVLIEDSDTTFLCPDPYKNINKVTFVKSVNGFYMSKKEEDDASIYVMKWKPYGGNNRKLSVGTGEEEYVKLDTIIPDMEEKLFVERRRTSCIIPNLNMPFRFQSKLFPTDDKSSDIHLLYYRGLTTYKTSAPVRFEDMRPVVQGQFSLSSTGEYNLGEKYLKQWLKLNNTSKTITYKLRIPVYKMFEILRLLQPQEEKIYNQVRFISVDNVKSMPKKISFEVDNTSDLILCEIESVRPD